MLTFKNSRLLPQFSYSSTPPPFPLGYYIYELLSEIDGFFVGFVEAACSNEDARDLVRVHVGRRTTIFEVAFLFSGNMARDADGGTAVSNRVAESVPTRGFVVAGQTALVVETTSGVVRSPC